MSARPGGRVAIAAALILTVAATGAGRGLAAICGDADGDGAVTTRDGVRILHAAGGADPCALAACDLDGDGRVTAADAALALRRATDLTIADHCGAGSIAGTLLILPAPALEHREHEPNDGPGTAAIVGRLAPGSFYRLTGALAGDDPFDGWSLLVTSSVRLTLTLDFDARSDVDLDLLVAERGGGAASCEQTTPGHEVCAVTIGITEPRPVDVVVAPAAGSSPAAYDLHLHAERADPPLGVTAGPGAETPIDLDPAVYRGDLAEIVPGEVVVQMAAANAAGGTRATAALAAALRSAAVAEGLMAEISAPDGTTVLTLTLEAALTNGTTGDRYAKRARAALRARGRAVAAALAASPGVAAAVPNRVVRPARVPGDPLFERQWNMRVIGLPRAWDVTIGGPAAVVAVIDTGIRSDHPDLGGRLVDGFDFVSSPARAGDGDGLDPDPFDPGDRPSEPERGTFHGTHVAGTIAAATNNAVGVAGVTWRTNLMPLRALGIGGGTVFDVAQAIRYAAGLPNVANRVPARPAHVLNLSLTTTGSDAILANAVDAAVAAGALVVAAAGNTGREGFVSPAGFPNVLSVAATDRLGSPARYSSFGSTVDVAAPGGDTHHDRDTDGFPDGILSTLAPGTREYGPMQGTSMAAAHVSGVAALLLGVPGGASASLLRQMLLATSDDRGAPGRDDRYGAGLVDAAAAVRLLAGLPPPTEPLLVLESTALRIAADESTLAVPLRNAGGDALVLEAPTAVTSDGVPWLEAAIDGNALRVMVDREGLAPGDATGWITLRSNGGAVEVAVTAEVAAPPPEDIGTVVVQLREPTSRAVIATAVTDAGQGYRYRIDGIEPGRYQIVAGTDRDGDGVVCEVGDACGAYADPPLAITVFGGASVVARDFGLTLVLVESDSR